MAEHRTKQQKIKAQQRIARMAEMSAGSMSVGGYSFSAKDLKKSTTPSLSPAQLDHNRAVMKDLMKTVAISVILMSIVVGIYFYIRYN